jgi:hypothetical protein
MRNGKRSGMVGRSAHEIARELAKRKYLHRGSNVTLDPEDVIHDASWSDASEPYWRAVLEPAEI